MVLVESIDQRGASGGRVHISLSDGSSFFVPRELPEALGLVPGGECEEAALAELRHAHLLHEATEKAVELLARSEHSRFLLARKLLQREFPQEVIREGLDSLEERGLLDDRRFAEQWVASRVRRRPEGETALVAGLQARGVDGTLAREVVEAFRREFPEELERAIERAGARIRRRPGVDAAELREKLQRRGFRPSDVTAYIERLSDDSFL
ncbi:MAG: regulatory protein RecX [Spirochaetota bacterium]